MFDRALRLLILDAIERIGVSVRTLSHLRNLCAHHSRIWNRELTLITSLPRNKPLTLTKAIDRGANNRKIYNALCMIKHLLDVISPTHSWHQRLAIRQKLLWLKPIDIATLKNHPRIK